jgi:hypothetical protein
MVIIPTYNTTPTPTPTSDWLALLWTDEMILGRRARYAVPVFI